MKKIDFPFGWRGWVYLVASLGLGFYLLVPAPKFPEPLGDFYWSIEPADRETPLRRGYYTNFYRGDVIFHYWDEMSRSGWEGVPLPTVRLSNYPPEEATLLVRDQTRANYLEELVHPMRESLYVAALESVDPLTYHEREGKRYQNKVVVKYVISSVWVRFFVGMVGLWLLLYLVERTVREVGEIIGKNE